MRHFVYILQSHDGRYYTGYTTDLKKRMEQHRSGKGARFTRSFGFRKLLYHEKHRTRSEAMKREAEIKSWSRDKKEELTKHRFALRKSFPVLVSPEAKILILGSMPGERSLRAQQYYAHPQNIFWEMMGDLFGAGRQTTYPARLQILNQNRVALWDVVFQCYRSGSLDTNIRMESVVPNDFVSLFSRCPKVETVFFNGHKAEQLFRKLVLGDLLKNLGERSNRLRFLRLPSTSPAHASLTRDQKKARWHRELKAALGSPWKKLFPQGSR